MDAFDCIKTKLDIREFSQEEVAEHVVGSMEFKGRLRTIYRNR